VQISMLGPLEIRGDAPTTAAGARLRTLVMVLALEPGRLVSTGRLVDGIWGEDPPSGAVNALQALVSRLRKALPDAVIESHPAGYRLVLDPDSVDVIRFERLVASAKSASDPAGVLREALALWRGPALQDVADDEFFQPHVARLTELRLVATEDRVEAELRLGRDLTNELTALVTEHPLRERLVGSLMRALCAAGRVNEALAVYERTREALADALGADPSPELSALHTSILRGELAATDERPRTNLRAGMTSFVGRDDDVARIVKLIGEHRLTTLTGLGGAGKTRLSIEAARTLLDQMPDGVWLVELAPVSDGADVAQAVLAALGLRDQSMITFGPATEPIDRLAAALSARRALLVLDNCEHVIEATAALTDRLLGDCPDLRILATSREPLDIIGEALWPVEPLSLPPEHATATEAQTYAAVRLLSDRASAARHDFEVTDQTVSHVVRICRALDGIPLAIELAAARLRTMTVEQLASRLDDRFRLLTGGSRTALPRHQTLRAVIDWSWDLLLAKERGLLRRFAVFSGGATEEAAERVCADDALPAADIFDLLTTLADKSLLVAGERYRMLETIRGYALARLDEAGERDRIRAAHAAYFVDLAEHADPLLRTKTQLTWLDRLKADHDNINAALRGAVAADDAETAVRLVAAAGWYWWLAGNKVEGADLAAEALSLPGKSDDETKASAYAVAALLAVAGNDTDKRAETWFEAALQFPGVADARHPILRIADPMRRLFQSVGPVPAREMPQLQDPDPWVRATARMLRASMRLDGDPAGTESDMRQALTEYEALGDRWGISFSLTVLADLTAWRGDLAAGIDHYEQAITAASEMGISEDTVHMRLRLAQLRRLSGDSAGAAATIAEAERDAKRVGTPSAIGPTEHIAADLARWDDDLATARTRLTRAAELTQHPSVHPGYRLVILDSMGYLDVAEGDLVAAAAHWTEALDLAIASGSGPLIAHVLPGVANLALHQGNPLEAARLLAAAQAVRGMPDLAGFDVTRVEKATRAALSEEDFAEATRRGLDATVGTVRDIAADTLSP
jgi:pentatricopeptide repeat protein